VLPARTLLKLAEMGLEADVVREQKSDQLRQPALVGLDHKSNGLMLFPASKVFLFLRSHWYVAVQLSKLCKL